MSELPEPDPALLRAAREHLTSRYAQGVEAVLWEMRKHPMHNLDAVARVLDTDHRPEAEAADGVSAMDIGAAFLVLMAARSDVDRLEAGLFDRALAAGVGYEQLAAVLGLDDADIVRERHRRLRKQAGPGAAGPKPKNGGPARGQAAAARHATKTDDRQAPEHQEELGLPDRSRDGTPAAPEPSQIQRLTLSAYVSAAQIHEAAAQRHETAVDKGVGDATEHRRLAEQHLRAAEANRASAERFNDDEQRSDQ
jgi:hypothetical protein